MKKNSIKINILIILLTGLFTLAPTCQSGITQSTTYPIELFSEMHYSPAHKSQETPRLKPAPEAVVFSEKGSENQGVKGLARATWIHEPICPCGHLGLFDRAAELLQHFDLPPRNLH